MTIERYTHNGSVDWSTDHSVAVMTLAGIVGILVLGGSSMVYVSLKVGFFAALAAGLGGAMVGSVVGTVAGVVTVIFLGWSELRRIRTERETMTDVEWENWGYPSREPCIVCGKTGDCRSELRFGYTVCRDHAHSVIPSRLIRPSSRPLGSYKKGESS